MGELKEWSNHPPSLSLSVLSELGATNECLRATITPSRALNWAPSRLPPGPREKISEATALEFSIGFGVPFFLSLYDSVPALCKWAYFARQSDKGKFGSKQIRLTDVNLNFNINCDAGKWGNFDKRTPETTNADFAYDYDSIMHYGPYFFR